MRCGLWGRRKSGANEHTLHAMTAFHPLRLPTYLRYNKDLNASAVDIPRFQYDWWVP